jgi:hypothetical protein
LVATLGGWVVQELTLEPGLIDRLSVDCHPDGQQRTPPA